MWNAKRASKPSTFTRASSYLVWFSSSTLDFSSSSSSSSVRKNAKQNDSRSDVSPSLTSPLSFAIISFYVLGVPLRVLYIQNVVRRSATLDSVSLSLSLFWSFNPRHFCSLYFHFIIKWPILAFVWLCWVCELCARASNSKTPLNHDLSVVSFFIKIFFP